MLKWLAQLPVPPTTGRKRSFSNPRDQGLEKEPANITGEFHNEDLYTMANCLDSWRTNPSVEPQTQSMA